MAKVIKIEATKLDRIEKKKVAAYARVSVNTEDSLHSLSSQISYYNSMIQANPEWEFAGIYYDYGITGTSTKNRKGFNDMIRKCRNHEIDILLVKSISRFARNTVDALKYTRELKSLGIDIYFERERIHTLSYEGELLLTLLASYAQEEAMSTSENVKWAVRKKFKEGLGDNHKAPYGYRWDGEKYIIIKEQAAVVKRIFGMYISGESSIKISRTLYEEGIRGQRGGRIDDTSVRYMLGNPAYKGTLRLQKWYKTDEKVRKVNKGAVPSYEVDDVYEPIVSSEDFDKVQKIRQERNRLYHKTDIEKHYLSGKCSCGECGLAYVRKKNKRTPVKWVCNHKMNTYIPEKKSCINKCIYEDDLIGMLSDTLKTADAKKLKEQTKHITIYKDYCVIQTVNGMEYRAERPNKKDRKRR